MRLQEVQTGTLGCSNMHGSKSQPSGWGPKRGQWKRFQRDKLRNNLKMAYCLSWRISLIFSDFFSNYRNFNAVFPSLQPVLHYSYSSIQSTHYNSSPTTRKSLSRSRLAPVSSPYNTAELNGSISALFLANSVR